MTAHVLVVDDSPIDRRLAGALLSKRGFTVAYANDGRAALDVINTTRPDVVVTDLQMPEMDGLQLVEAVKRTHPSLPVVLVTAHGSEQIAMVALRAGATSYVTKRRLAQDLADTVAAIVAISHEAGRVSTVDPIEMREARYTLGADFGAISDVVGQLESQLVQLNLCGETAILQVAVALREAIVNAVVHGNLEVSSELLDGTGAAFTDLIERRKNTRPYCDRRVRVVARYQLDVVEYVIADEGPGFDPSTLPDPTDISNLEKPSGRGLMLIRTFMDEVAFNDRGNEIRMAKFRESKTDPS
ncbi:MAG: response regulator [Polyangiaceae bacterium]